MKEETERFFSTERGKRFGKFLAIGIFGLGLNELIIFICLVVLDILFLQDLLFSITTLEIKKIQIASLISITVVMITNFFLNKIWTFKEQEKDTNPNTLKQLIQFALIGLTGLAIYQGIIYLFHNVLGLNEYFSTSIGFFLGLINNFIWNDLWTFNPKFIQKENLNH